MLIDALDDVFGGNNTGASTLLLSAGVAAVIVFTGLVLGAFEVALVRRRRKHGHLFGSSLGFTKNWRNVVMVTMLVLDPILLTAPLFLPQVLCIV